MIKKLFIITAILLILFLNYKLVFADCPLGSSTTVGAFPGALGFGRNSVGGSGRHLSVPSTTVYKVTNLNDSGLGSLRACIEAVGPRTCVFETSGRIPLRSQLQIKNPYITIAGQTAPSPGILLSDQGIRVMTNNVTITHIWQLCGDKPYGAIPATSGKDCDGIAVAGSDDPNFASRDVIIDHNSIGWAIDENLSTGYTTTKNVTFSNNLVYEGLDCSIHSVVDANDKDKCHSKGFLWAKDTKLISMIRNVFAHNFDRNPVIQPNSSGEIINNLVYNWGPNGGQNILNVSDYNKAKKAIFFDITGNYYKYGPTAFRTSPLWTDPKYPVPPGSKFYLKDNFGPTRTESTQSDWLFSNFSQDQFGSNSCVNRGTCCTYSPPASVEGMLLRNAGARPKDRNAVDARIVYEVATRTGAIKDCVEKSSCDQWCANRKADPSECTAIGAWPSVAVVTRTLTIPSDKDEIQSSGYTKLEEWIQTYTNEVQ